jgi:hypothetical protein
MSKPATKDSWETLEPPKARAPLGYEYAFNDVDAERLRDGLIPQEMEDKWFAYFENGWLYLHRSWTGELIYWLRLEGCPTGMCVVESWVNRDAEQYRETDISYDRALLDFLLRGLILGHRIPFPARHKDVETGPAGLYQHHMIGRKYPEKVLPDDRPNDESGA